MTIVVVMKPRMASMTERAVKRNNDKYNDNLKIWKVGGALRG